MKVMVTGDCGIGKTSYLLKVARNESFMGNSVIFYTPESIDYIANAHRRPHTDYANVLIVTGIKSISDIRNDIFDHEGQLFNTVIIDGVERLVDIADNQDATKLSPFMFIAKAGIYFSLPTRHHILQGRDNENGPSFLYMVSDRIIKLERNADGLNANILKDPFNQLSSYPIEL